MNFLLDHDVPEDLRYLLDQLGHTVVVLREVLPPDSTDEAVLQAAYERDCVLLTCNRDDFLSLAATVPHHGPVIIIVIIARRRSRADERAALFRLLERAGEPGLRDNINFALCFILSQDGPNRKIGAGFGKPRSFLCPVIPVGAVVDHSVLPC